MRLRRKRTVPNDGDERRLFHTELLRICLWTSRDFRSATSFLKISKS